MDKQNSSDKLHVAHLVLSLDCGGLERVVLDLIRGGVRREQQTSVVCLERPGDLAVEAQSLGATVLCLHKSSGIDFGLSGRVRGALSKLRPDVVHSHQIGALFYAGAAAQGLGVPAIIHTEHGVHYRTRRRTRLLARFAARRAHRFCCVSEEIAADVCRYRIASPDRILVIRNGIDTARFARTGHAGALRQEFKIPADAFVIGTVGRLSEIKRQDVLIRGFSRVRKRVPNAHLLLVGDGPCRNELQQLSQFLGLCGNVHFAGYQSQPEQYLQAMDVFALTSRSEGMPLAVLEAWSVGLPVVASRVGGLPELIDDGQNGLFFAPGDDHDLAAKLETLLADPVLANRVGAAGQRHVRSNYDIVNMADTYHHHYLQLLKGNHNSDDAYPRDHKSVSEPLSASASDL